MWDKWIKVAVALMVGCAVGVGLMVLYRPGAARIRKLEDELEHLRASNKTLEIERSALNRRKVLLERDPLTIEIEARERFGLVKEGETVYIVKDWPADSLSDRR